MQVGAHLILQHLLDDAQISTVGDVADGCYNLELGSTFVDGEDTCITEQALTLVLHNEARTSVYRDGIVSILVGILRVHTLGQRREGIGQAGVLLEFLTLLGSELAVTLNVFECFVDVDVTSRLIQERTTGIQLGLHRSQHIIDSGEVDDLLTELGTLLGIG